MVSRTLSFVLAGILFCMSLAGCAAIVPNTIAIEQDHLSHVLQHFQDNPTNYGINTINVVARWQARNAYAEISEGVTIGAERFSGGREVFNARVGYAFPLK